MRIEIRPADEASAEVSALVTSVWTPEVVAKSAWRDIITGTPERRILVWDEQGRLASHIALFSRDALLNGRSVRVAGVGGVCTRPDCHEQGLGRTAMARAADYFAAETAADFALLFCAPPVYRFYERCGWRQYSGDVVVDQAGRRVSFTISAPFVLDLKLVPEAGLLDLRGPPW